MATHQLRLVSFGVNSVLPIAELLSGLCVNQ